ncbi:MAG: phosphomannomutase/phosphoglucomutase [Marinilabiliales bacterium]|nr:MAG: phosphomannomutase/phosphoglucomutase [Marinilabiliales bacterium]
MKAFKAYDIRGVWGEDLSPEIAYKTGYFIVEILNAKRILIGRDIRNSSPEMHKNILQGLIDAGAEVYDAGICTTPMVYWATGKYNFDASLMITASHNPKEYNGIKVSAKNVRPIGYDDGLNVIERNIESAKDTPFKDGGSMQTIEIRENYLDFLRSYIDFSNELNVSIDFSSGMAALFAKDLFPDANCINEIPDGNFPAHEPNPLEPENQEQIKEQVLNNNSDIGVIFDGDADRVMFVDEKGKFISPDLIIALLGHYFLEGSDSKNTVVQDIRTSKAVGEYLSQFDTNVEIWKVGRAFGASKLKELNAIYGGELAGHYYFRDFYFSDSGLLAAIMVLNIVDKFRLKGIKLSKLISNISPYHNTGEVNFKIEDKKGAMDAVRDHFMRSQNPERYLDFDGYRLDFHDWWFNIRPSNTEPYLRFLAEAKSQELLEEKTNIIYSILKRFK